MTKITQRQKQLLAMLEQGLSNRDIAEKLDISEHTVKVHFWRLFNRIGVTSRTQALKWWHDNQPSEMRFAMRAAFDAACRVMDQLKARGQLGDIEEFEHHRARVQQFQGASA